MVDRGTLLIAGLSIIGVIAGYWVYVTFAPSYVGIIFAGMCFISLIVAVLARPIGSALGNTGASANSPDLRVGQQLILGIIFGLFFIALAYLTPFAIGVPTVSYAVSSSSSPFSAIGPSIVQTVIAPISEELFFFFVIPFLLYSLLMGWLRSRPGAVALTIILTSSLFALYHFRAYGATLLLSGAFIAAGSFRLVVLLIAGIRGRAFSIGFEPASVAPVLLTAILMHVSFNIAVVAKALVVTG